MNNMLKLDDYKPCKQCNKNEACKEHVEYQVCKKCGKTFPKCDEYFHRDKKHKNGLRKACKTCRNTANRKYAKKEENKEKKKINSKKRRGRESELRNDITKEEREYTLEFFDHSCAYCKLSAEEHKTVYGQEMNYDHVKPVISGGAATLGNIVPCCRKCNSSKGTKELVEWYTEQNFFEETNLKKILDFINLMN